MLGQLLNETEALFNNKGTDDDQEKGPNHSLVAVVNYVISPLMT